LGKISENLGKIPKIMYKMPKYLGKIPENLGKNGAQRCLTSKQWRPTFAGKQKTNVCRIF